MSLTKEQKKQISDFSSRSDFRDKGGLMTDLDGTVIQEIEGKAFIPSEVQQGLADMYKTSCPIIINTIRFPLSVIRTFAYDWYDISKASVPLVSLNGSQIGYMNKDKKSKFTFQEVNAYPLNNQELRKIISEIDNILCNGAVSMLVFYYPRAWNRGEIIWTSQVEKLAETKEKYKSASEIYAGDLQTLQHNLEAEDINMIFLLTTITDLTVPHLQTSRKDFYTHNNVDKLYGANKMISYLGLEIENFIGSGDTPMDVFLREVGQVIKVGNLELNFECKSHILQLEHVPDIGEVFTEIAKNGITP